MDALRESHGMFPPSQGRIESLVDLWHAHRGPLILCALAVLFAFRIYIHLHHDEGELIALPKAYNKVPLPAPGEVERRDEKRGAKQHEPRRIRGALAKKSSDSKATSRSADTPVKILIFFSSVTTKTETVARRYASELAASTDALAEAAGRPFLEPEVRDLADIEFDDYFVSLPKLDETCDFFYLFLIPSYNIDTINDTFLQHLDETHNDFRVDTGPLSSILGYSVFGFGDTEGWPNEKEGFCFQATQVDKWMAKLTGRKRAYPVGMGDLKSDHAERFLEWTTGIRDTLTHVAKTGTLGEGIPGSGDAVESDIEDEAYDDEEVLFEDEEDDGQKKSKAKSSGDLADLEDLGRMVKNSGDGQSINRKGPLAVDFTNFGATKPKRKTAAPASAPPKEMVAKDSPTYKALTKQGYAIVGSHSGVKICRWTKSALRGRGSCYKYSLYGINSHQCMETTPALSCSNKCVFCWRHGTNPVGTTWRWVVDPPDLIFDGVKDNHYKKIRMMRGMPGVRSERYNEALRIRHCALSLVGEPIFYPYVNEFLALLHGERISSFLVCNAQHPDQLAALKAVTQLYVSIDASNKESLKKIDRPLHRDYWERFTRCLDILREKRFRQRTVYRLTLVKGFNVEDEAEGYAQLVERGLPCFIEVKGVTYCGTSTSSNAGLTMQNVPWYWEVCDFARALEQKLRAKGLAYSIAVEHAHSCCILLASERFLVDGKWHTHIDYQRFFELLEERGADGDWTPEDYMGPPTPEWALWGNGGFDPRDDRVDRKGNRIDRVVIRDRPEDAE